MTRESQSSLRDSFWNHAPVLATEVAFTKQVPSAKADSADCTSPSQHFRFCVKTFFRPAGAMNLLHFVPRTYVRGYILVPRRGSSPGLHSGAAPRLKSRATFWRRAAAQE